MDDKLLIASPPDETVIAKPGKPRNWLALSAAYDSMIENAAQTHTVHPALIRAVRGWPQPGRFHGTRGDRRAQSGRACPFVAAGLAAFYSKARHSGKAPEWMEK